LQSNDCGVGSGQKPVFTVGCGDVAEVPSRLVADYHSYKCQLALNHDIDEKVTVRIPTTPHDPNGIVPGMQVCTCSFCSKTVPTLTIQSRAFPPWA